MNYRYDQRSKKEFERDIKEHTSTERALFMRWLDYLQKSTGERPAFKDCGCGSDGEYLEDQDVNTNPDFAVDGYGFVEVKFSKPMLKTVFHLKKNQVDKYIKKNATVLMFNGTNDDDGPQFTMLKTEALQDVVDGCKVVNWKGFGYKPAYRVPVSKFIWRKL